jgi:3-methyl-2-oxobutanoate hydroxymethyltransferase
MPNKRKSTVDIKASKGGEPIVCLTAYTTQFAKILDPHTDILLVGDSLGMVIYGLDSTLPVTLEMMIQHGQAVMRGSSTACVIVDMPFASYQESPAQAFKNAAKIMQETGAQGIKLEGGVEMAETIKFLVERGIPVMGHVGLMPQMVNAYGGFTCRGKTPESRKKVMEDAVAAEKAGCFAVVVEGVVEDLAREVTKKLKIPVIGIGGSSACDGQILVSDDVAGMFTDFKPKFVKRYGNMAGELENAAKNYAADVRARKFPGDENVF